MHILVIPSWYPDNSTDFKGSFFRDQAMALKEYGHQIGVFVIELVSLKSFFSGDYMGFISEKYELDEGIPTYRIKVLNIFPGIPWLSNWWLTFVARCKYRKYCVHYGTPDVLHAHAAIRGGWIATNLVKKKNQLPVTLITEHMSAFSNGKISDFILRIAHRAFVKADAIIFVSEKLKSDIYSSMSHDLNSKNFIIPNIISERYISLPEKYLAKLKRGSNPVFLNIASLYHVKDHQTLLHAFRLVLKKFPDAKLRIVGDGPERENLQRLTQSLGVQNNIEFLGSKPVDQVPLLLNDADIFVLSSTYETFGVVVIEALAMGLPVVATRCGGPESILTEKDGILVNKEDPYELSRAMISIVQNIDTYNTSAIRQRAINRFGPHAVAKKLTNLYTSLLPNG